MFDLPVVANITSFPTLWFLVALALCFLFWVGVFLGIIDPEADMGLSSVGLEGMGASAGITSGVGLMREQKSQKKHGLAGLPPILILTFVTTLGTLFSFVGIGLAASHFGAQGLGLGLRIAIGLAALVLSGAASKVMMRPLKPLLRTAEQKPREEMVGEQATVITGKVTEDFGLGRLSLNGLTYEFDIRASTPNEIKRHDMVVLLEYDPEQKLFFVEPA